MKFESMYYLDMPENSIFIEGAAIWDYIFKKDGLKDKYSLWEKATIGSKVSANIAKMGSSTAGILSIARLGMEPKLQEGDKGFQHQVAVNEALRAAIEARVRSNNRKHHADYNSHKRRRLLSMDNAFLQRATVNKANAQEQKIMKAIQMKGNREL